MAKVEEEKKRHYTKNLKNRDEHRNKKNNQERKNQETVKVVKKKTIVKKPFHKASKDKLNLKEEIVEKKTTQELRENKPFEKKTNQELHENKPFEKKSNQELHENKSFEKKNKIRISSNRNSTIIIAVVMILLIILLIVLGIKSFSKKCDPNGIIAVGPFGSEEEPVANTGDIIRTKEAFDKLFNYKGMCKPNFEEHSYAVIVVSYDTCQKKNLEFKKFDLEDNKLTFYMTYEGKCKNCDIKYTYYLVPVPATSDKLEIEVNYERTNELNCVLKDG